MNITHTKSDPWKIDNVKLHPLHQSFIMGKVQLRSFCEISSQEAEMLWSWRNHQDIRKWMYNPDPIPKENHFKFLENLPNKTDNFYWIVIEDGEYLGVVNFTNFKEAYTEWGFYLSPELFGRGKSINLLYNALNFFFKCLDLDYVYGFVRCDNQIAVKFHDFIDIQKTGLKEIDVKGENILFEKRVMTKERWLSNNMTLQDWKDKRAKEKANRK